MKPENHKKRSILGRVIRWTGLLVLVLMLGAAGFGIERYITLQNSLPQISGERRVAGLNQPVEIIRDRYGVPHIYASTLEDALFALGLVHAQDRLWQMDLIRRAGQGRLAEVFGAPALQADVNVRAAGLAAAARETLDLLSPEARRALDAYAQGVNEVIRNRDRPLPPEYTLTWSEPEPWAAEDSILFMNLLAAGLGANASSELLRVRLTQQLNRRQIAEFLAPAPGLPADWNTGPSGKIDWTPKNGAAPFTLPVEGGASNNWVVNGEWTQSGKPLLANDPHLGMSAPSIWYLAHLSIDGRNTIGGTIPGIPSVLVGRTDRVAWGLTTTGADVQDVVLEKLSPGRPNHYETPEGPAPFNTRREVFEVRFGAPHEEVYRSTRHGPVLPFMNENAPEGHVYALAWAALLPGNKTIEASLKVLTVETAEAARDALRDYGAPVQTVVFADVDGNIGLLAPGRIPVRNEALDSDGTVPVPGWTHDRLWTGMLGFEALPQSFNPDSGYLLSANNQIVPDDYPYLITRDWKLPFRAELIEAGLQKRRDHTVETFRRLQMDNTSGLAVLMLPAMLRIPPATESQRQAIALLRDWDRKMSPDRAEPLIFIAWYRALTKAIYSDELGDMFEGLWSARPVFISNVLTDVNGQSRWCDDVTTEATESCEALLSTTLSEAINELVEEYGDDMQGWRWGEAHKAVSRHLPLGSIPVAGRLFNIEVPSGGGNFAINRGGHRYASSRPYANTHSAGYRAVYDFVDLDRSIFSMSTGQSGNPYSEFYDNLAEPWAAGEYIPMTTDRDAIADGAAGTLRLISDAPPDR